MDIEPRILDALIEIANVGMNRAATQLSALLDDEIRVAIPQISIVDTAEVSATLKMQLQQEVSCVTQQLQGQIDGAAMLVFHSSECEALVKALIGSLDNMAGVDLRAYEHEAMTEIGNIIISSSTAVIADMLGGEIMLTVPEYEETTISELINGRVNSEADHDMKVVMMQARLEASSRNVEGNLIILMGVRSMQDLLDRIDAFLTQAAG
ncbi:MAG: hypothetical protein HKM22_05135 [Gammaproteobacteria bacterium]|nr:hypothetical protein [Gammaproteobacteria bacterium]